MISVSHISIYVFDQDSAHDFYVNKLGWEVRADAEWAPGKRWLAVGPKSQPDIDVVLMPVRGGSVGDEHVEALTGLIKGGAMGVGVLLTDDVWRDYRELSAKGVVFRGEPKEQFYGIETLMQDDSGNWFSLTQRTGG